MSSAIAFIHWDNYARGLTGHSLLPGFCTDFDRTRIQPGSKRSFDLPHRVVQNIFCTTLFPAAIKASDEVIECQVQNSGTIWRDDHFQLSSGTPAQIKQGRLVMARCAMPRRSATLLCCGTCC